MEAVGQDVARPQLVEDPGQRDVGVAHVDHDRQARGLGDLEGGGERDSGVGAGEVAGEAENGKQAIELCQALQPDVVIMQSLKMGKKNKPPFFGRLNDQELLDVIQYTRTLR